MHQPYYESILLIERLHRHFLEVLKNELDRLGIQDINNVQSLILYNIGADEMTVGELTARGYYLGSNVSYNVKKMVENGYLGQERSPHDRRSVRVRLSDKGLDLRNRISSMFERQITALDTAGFNSEELSRCNEIMHRLERFWSQALEYGAFPIGPQGAANLPERSAGIG
ncbi:MAG: MarR family winged helix-turn-helix transcriptional regulator [Rhodospirillaceae bacterium]